VAGVTVAELFDAYAAAFARGERPDVRDYLDRAGADREELARLIDAFLRSTVPPPPNDDAVAALRARLSGEPPLLALRKQRALRVDDVVEELLRTQGWGVGKRAKVKRYYQRLEGGLLDARRVALPVLETIARLLGVGVGDFEGFRAEPLRPEAVFQRATALDAELSREYLLEPPDDDEVDRAFTAGR
jgi:hypothetical protein